MKKIFLRILFGLLLICSITVPINARAQGHTDIQISFYNENKSNQQITNSQGDHAIPNGSTSYLERTDARTPTSKPISGWISAAKLSGRLPQTDDLNLMYWKVVGIMGLAVLSLVGLCYQENKKWGEKHEHQ